MQNSLSSAFFPLPRRAFAVLTGTALLFAARPALPAEILVKDGQKVAFMGDSITAGGWGSPGGYVRLVVAGLEANGVKVTPIPAGISGHKSDQMLARLKKDALDKQPSWMTLSCGVNDVWHGEKDPTRGTMPDKFESGLEEVIGKCTAAGARVILCTPTVIGEKSDGSNSLDAKLDQYADISRGVAKKLNLSLCDLRKAFIDHLKANLLGELMNDGGLSNTSITGDESISKDLVGAS